MTKFETAEMQPYWSLLTFILFALVLGPVSRVILNFTFYLHGQRAKWIRLYEKVPLETLTKILLLWDLRFSDPVS